MELINEFLIQYGYAGMCIAAFLAGSFVPFNSEVVMAALLAASDMNPWLTVIWGTVGNVAGAAIGTVICLVLGVMRANPFVVLITSTIGKFLRYAILAYMVFSLAH